MGSVYVIVATPGDTPVTTPVVDTTVAIEVAPLLHVPPPASLSVIVAPVQTDDSPAMGDGNGSTVTTFVEEHPDVAVYDMVVVPAETPLTTPVEEPIVATDVVLLVQWPPVVASAIVIVEPTQTSEGPVIVPGGDTIVTVIGTRALRHPASVWDTQ